MEEMPGDPGECEEDDLRVETSCGKRGYGFRLKFRGRERELEQERAGKESGLRVSEEGGEDTVQIIRGFWCELMMMVIQCS